MHPRFRFSATVICLSAFLLLGFSSRVDETMTASPGLFSPMQQAGTVNVKGTITYPNRDSVMRTAWYVRVTLYEYQWGDIYPKYYSLGSTYTDKDGAFTFPPISNYDSVDYLDPDTHLDLIIGVEAYAQQSGISFSGVTGFNGIPYIWNEPRDYCDYTGLQWDVLDGDIIMDYAIQPTNLNRPAMWLLRDEQRSWDYVTGYSDPGSTSIAWQNGANCYPFPLTGINNCGSFFSGPLGTFIFLRDDARISSDVVVHEIGHNYMYNVTASHYWYASNTCTSHDIWSLNEEKCAWSEGWADFFPLLVNWVPNDTCYDRQRGPCMGTRNTDYFDLENQGWGDGQALGRAVEGRVAGALYDLYDSNNEGPFDIATNSFQSMWIVMRDRPSAAQTLFDFGDSWKYNYPYGPFLLVSYQNTIDYGVRWNRLPLLIK